MKALSKYFAMGAAIPGSELSSAERQLLFDHFTCVTPENCMKPAPIHPAEARYDFAKAEALVAMAHGHGLSVNGHTLVWHHQCPDWFFKDGDRPATRDLVRQRLRAHIAAVAGHFAGQLKSWDVVNEALGDGADYLRQSQWLSSLGPDYLAEAFFAARQADPQAELYYNDYGIECQPKRDKALRLVRELKQCGAPLHGIGIQGHWQLDRIPFADIEAAILAFHAEGLLVMITELDLDVVPRQAATPATGASVPGVGDPYAQGLSAEAQARLAEQYAQLFALFLKHRDKLSRVTFWGLHDGRSWLNAWPTRRTNHPLLWDRALQAKPALAAIRSLLPEPRPN